MKIFMSFVVYKSFVISKFVGKSIRRLGKKISQISFITPGEVAKIDLFNFQDIVLKRRLF